MEKIAVSSTGPTLDSAVDARFGRAAGFVIVDAVTMAAEFVTNEAAQSRGQGAGIQAAETVARHGAKVVLSGFVGPKAFDALRAAGIVVVQDMAGISVRDAVARYNSGEAAVSEAAAGGPAMGKGGGRGMGRGRGMAR